MTPGHVTCPHCSGEPLDGHEVGVYCVACNGTGRVCSYCAAATVVETSAIYRAGECLGCGSTVEHRTTFATYDLWLAAYDPGEWQGLFRRANDALGRAREDLSAERDRCTSLTAERDHLRAELQTAKAELMQYVDKANAKIQEQHREHRREVEDLQRQLRRQRVPMTADQIERDDGEGVAA